MATSTHLLTWKEFEQLPDEHAERARGRNCFASETPGTLRRKVDLLLAAGSLAVWVIYPEERKIQVFLPDGTSFSLGINDVLTLPELLPDWELPVAKIFAD